jgi:hypothetical protein
MAIGVTGLLLLMSALVPHTFQDGTGSSGIGFTFEASKTPVKYLIEAMGGGVAMFDADGDGKLDLFFSNGAALHPAMTAGEKPDKSAAQYWNRLYRNLGNFQFQDITEQAGLRGSGYSQGVAVGDCDNDGKQDLYVTGLGTNALYRNRGAGAFEDITAKSGTAGGGWSTSAGFLDFDRDGQLDLFVARYLKWDFDLNKPCGGEGEDLRAYCHPNEFEAVSHLLFRNRGGCTFEDVSSKSGISKAPGKGLGVAFGDFDRDGWPDIAVANDSHPQQLFRNQGNGSFEETGLPAGIAYDEDGKVFAGMGIDFADYNNDSWPDVFVNALANQGYGLFANREGLFAHNSVSAGIGVVSKMHSGWGAKFFDFDNDGWKDLFVAQGHVMDNIERTQPETRYREAPLLARNVNGKFKDVSQISGKPFANAMAARGAAFGDLNGDGAIDIVVSAIGERPRVIRNQASNHWIVIDAVGAKSNRDGIGAVVRIVMASGAVQHGFVSTSGSYLSAHDKRLHFGLGNERAVKQIEIRWPGGTEQVWKNVPADQVFVAREVAQ